VTERAPRRVLVRVGFAVLMMIVGVVGGLVASALMRHSSVPSTGAVGDTPVASGVVRLDQHLVADPPDGASWDTSGSYLQVSGVSGLEAVNSALRNVIAQDEQELRQRFERSGSSDVQSVGDYSSSPGEGYISASSAVVSMLIPTNSAFPGGRHGNAWVSGTFLVPSATPVTLSSLFADPSVGMAAVAAAARAQFLATDSCVRQAITDPVFGSVPAAGLDPTLENYQNFALTPAGLTIGFPQGQIASNACDRQMVTIEWPQLQPLLSPAGLDLVGRLR
jgi:Protein of unknown function (DUF3298)